MDEHQAASNRQHPAAPKKWNSTPAAGASGCAVATRRPARITAPNGGQGYDAEAGKPGDRKVGDAAMRDLVTPKDGCAEISGLVEWQRRLNAHYR